MLRLPSILVAMAIAAISSAWVDTGHCVIAALAWGDLTRSSRAESERLLGVGPRSLVAEFVDSACWADDIRKTHRETAGWHYTDYPVRLDSQPATGHAKPKNVVWAIRKFAKVLANPNQSDENRADALRYLLHFVGDVHQPLHAASLESEAFPTGDKGGNDFPVEFPRGWPEVTHPNLHLFWDFGGGLFVLPHRLRRPLGPDGLATVDGMAEEIRRNWPRQGLPELSANDPREWAAESYRLAKSFAYRTEAGGPQSDAYIQGARKICEKRTALAGYRLADLLNHLLNEAKNRSN